MTPPPATICQPRNIWPVRWQLVLFVVCSLACMAIVFGSALWNASILAPLDIPAAMYSKYHWLNDTQGPVPNNHYTVDIFSHELPRQYAIYRAVQSGEFPWWDPYTGCGRPLVAEGHISGTDAPRLILYRLLPFVAAYNLVKLFHSFLLGLGVFILLRHWGHRLWVALGLALAFEFAGTFALLQTPLCVPASAAWYPWIWLAWSVYMENRKIRWPGAAGIFCALSFAAGNAQTDAFLAIFAACFVAGSFWYDHHCWKASLAATVISTLLGALIALPVLVPQAELLLLSKRVPEMAHFSPIQAFTGPFSLTAVFPWALGTFRTPDLSKALGQTGLGFCLFLGSAAVALGLLGAVRSFTRRTPQGCVGLLLVLIYLLICSTPLTMVFYTRLAALAVLGLVVLAAEGARDVVEGTLLIWQKRLACLAFAVVLGALLCCNLVAFWVFPRIRAPLESAIMAREQANMSFGSSPSLRRDQLNNFAREISVLNPETVLSLLGVGALLAAVGVGNTRHRPFWLAVALVLNLAPELTFAHRFTTSAPVPEWNALIRGGPEQRKAMDALKSGLRLKEVWPGYFDPVFPSATADYYAVHVTHTYSSFPLPDLEPLWENEPDAGPWADAICSSENPEQSASQLTMTPPRPVPSRFQWLNESERKVKIMGETLDTITVEVEDGPPGELARTDRYYPGWKLLSPGFKTRLESGAFLVVQVPRGPQTLVFQYRPRWLPISLCLATAALMACAFCVFAGWSRSAKDSRRVLPPK